MDNLIQLPKTGYIIELPYDPEVGCVVIISVIPYTEEQKEFILKHFDQILATKTRLHHEDDFCFKARLEEVIENIKAQRGLKH